MRPYGQLPNIIIKKKKKNNPVLKGIVSDSNNIFYGMNQKI